MITPIISTIAIRLGFIIIIISRIVELTIFFIPTAVTSHALLELMEASVSQLVNAKTEDLVILCLENATAQKDGL